MSDVEETSREQADGSVDFGLNTLDIWCSVRGLVSTGPLVQTLSALVPEVVSPLTDATGLFVALALRVIRI